LISLPPDDASPAALLDALLDVSLTGVIFFRPVYDAAGTTLVDFAYERLNPAARQMLGLPARPTESFLTRYPSAATEEGVFAFYRDTFLDGQLGRHQFNYQHDGLDGYFLLAAQRQGPLLVVSFTDTNDQPRTAVEQALRESQAREQAARQEAERQRQHLYNMFEQAPAMICIFEGPQHTFQFVNPPYQALVGNRPLVGKPIAEAMPELAGQPIFGLLDQVYQTGETFYANEMLVQLDHHNEGREALEKRYYNFIYQARHNLAGDIDGILVFAYEVTPQVLAQQALQALNQELEARVHRRTQELETAARRLTEEREGFYQTLTQTTGAVAILRGPEHRHVFYNAAYERLFPNRNLVGDPIGEVFPEVVAQGFDKVLDEVYRTGETYYGYEVPAWMNQPDGEVQLFYLNFAYSAYREAGEIVGISVFAYDVTEAVRSRQALEAQRQEQQRLFEQAPMAIVVLRGPEFIIEQGNANAEAIWGRSMAEVLGRPHFEALPDASGQGYEELLTGVLQSGQPLVLHEVPIRLSRAHTGLPEVGYYSIIFKPLRDEHGLATRIAVMWTEATDQVLARQQVQQLNDELTATNEELHKSNARLTRTNADLDTFVYTASHDLKSPIINIEGLLLALREQLPPETQHDETSAQLLAMMEDAVQRFQQTLGHLTDVSRLQQEQDQGQRPTEAVDLPALAEAVRRDILPELLAAHATLTVDLDYCTAMQGSPKTLRSVLYNLLSNAIKYRDPARPCQVVLRCRQLPGQLALDVQDNGLGLSEQQQGQLFRLFRRLHTHVEGSGVGLYMVKKMVDNAGGTLSVQSQLGVGSTFTVLLPAPGEGQPAG
jgi:signal transduction histidine kinase